MSSSVAIILARYATIVPMKNPIAGNASITVTKYANIETDPMGVFCIVGKRQSTFADYI